jgi:hypothetical protein
MKKQEVAAVRCAVKRSIKAKNIEVGYKHLVEWCDKWKEICNTELVMKCYKKWSIRKSF